MFHVCPSWTSQGKLAVVLPGPDLIGRDLALAHVGPGLDLMELQTRLVRLSAGSDWIGQFLAVFGLALIIIGHDKWSCLAFFSSGLSSTVVLTGTTTAVMVLAAAG